MPEKQKYFEAEIKMVCFEEKDVIATSGWGQEDEESSDYQSDSWTPKN